MPDSSPALPLAGILVLDATSNIAGPFGGAILADLGADVLKIETPAGDPSRSMSPVDGDRSAYFHIVNRNKDVEALDLKSANGKSRLHELLERNNLFVLIQLAPATQIRKSANNTSRRSRISGDLSRVSKSNSSKVKRSANSTCSSI